MYRVPAIRREEPQISPLCATPDFPWRQKGAHSGSVQRVRINTVRLSSHKYGTLQRSERLLKRTLSATRCRIKCKRRTDQQRQLRC
jgi:hypothetical protein